MSYRRTKIRTVGGLLAFGLMLVAGFVSGDPGPKAESAHAVLGLVYARPFVLAEPYTYSWSKDSLEVRSGTVVVLDVDPRFVQPRQTQMPVLYVDSRPAEIVSGANPDGRVVAIVPGTIDLKTATFFFGSTELPERVSRARGEAELAAASALGVRPLPAGIVTAAIAAGGDVLSVATVDGVYKSLAGVLEVYSPSETDRIASYHLIP